MLHNKERMTEIYELLPKLTEADVRYLDTLIAEEEVRFPLHAVPDVIYHLITNRHQVLHENLEFLTLGAISATAAAIGTKIQTSYQYTNKPIFWNAVVAHTGSGKTTPIKAMLEPVYQMQAASRIKFNDQMQEHEELMAEKKSQKGQKNTPPPLFKEFVISDLTYEGLIKSHLTNPEGVIIHVDEQIALVKSFGAYKGGKGGDQENFLPLHDGLGIQKSRASQEQIGISETCINIVGGFQPDVIPDFFAESRSEDGFIYRYLYVFEKEYKPTPITTGSPDTDVQKAYNRYIHSLYDNKTKRTLEFNEEAQQLYAYWKHTCETVFKNETQSVAYQAKLNKYVHRFALMFKVYDERDDSDIINKDHILDAIHAVEHYRGEFNKMMEYAYGERINRLPADYLDLYNLLEDTFTYAVAKMHAETLKLSETSLKSFLNRTDLFSKKRRGEYIKK